jgi:hypothetical protein
MGNLFQNQDIAGFFQNAINKDFARKNLFRVLNINSGSTGINFGPEDLVYITSTDLPGRSINNIPVPFMGLKFNVPGTATYPKSDAWNVTFRMPQDLSIRQKLELWTRGTFDDATSTGAYEVKNLGTIDLALMGKGGQVLRNYTLVGAYCTDIGSYELDVTTAGEIVTVSATIAYQYWVQPEASPIAV